MSVVRIDKTGNIGIIVIDNPPVNALMQSVREGIVAAVDAALADDEIEAIVLSSDGRTFSAGADIREFSKPPEPPHLPDVVHHLEASRKPVVAAIQGKALGGGLELALGCHYRVAAASASVGLPEVLLGLLPGAGGTQRLPRLVGVEAALDIMLSGRIVPAAQAKSIGLVDEIAEDDGLLEAAADFAHGKRNEKPPRVRDLSVPPFDAQVFDATLQRIAPRTRGLLSPGKIVDCVERATTDDYENGVAFEREAFAECKASPQSDGLRHAFFAEREVGRVPGLDKDTPPRDVERIAVIGAGTMGAGIAYAALLSGFDVELIDNSASGLDRGRKTIDGYFAYAVDKGKLSAAAADERRGKLGTRNDYENLSGVDLVIEAVYESMALKEEVFSALDARCRDGAILATNTSTLDVDRIAAATGRPQDVVGLHFFSPAHVMKLLEIVRGRETSDDVLATSMALARRLGKIGVVVGNCFGFVGNRMLYSYGRENQLMLLEGAPPETIDRVLCDWGMAMGPNAVGDLAGLDVGYKVRQERTDLPDDPRFYRVADRLAELGRYGQKTGQGIYRYEKGSRQPVPDPAVTDIIREEAARLGVPQRDIGAEEIVERCIYGLVTEGARILEEGIALRSADIDVIWINGYGFPRYRGGPMHYADRIGLDTVLARVQEFADRFGPAYWEPPQLLLELARSGGRFADYRAG
ncbi:MAG: 3-hydroxyacyl-CoA dehydrogenase NAD-binding domain-containing protein [Woeseiaceae bacterium]|nr:3-hydroxyacyl-CoA dehydrogenase NAD-binding domain-containing protein [Woeseiaceae bacterium]